MLLRASRPRRQRGQALLLVLVFVAAFLLLTWAGLTLAASSFLDVSSVQADTRSTYALDAGIGYGIEFIRNSNGNVCANLKNKAPAPLVLTYPTTSYTVTVGQFVAGPGCSKANPVIDMTISSTGTTRKLTAEVALVGTAWQVNWEQFQ